jgi:hypothetical protein
MADVLSLTSMAQSFGLPLWAFYLVLFWSLFWKATAMWKAGRLNKPVWFIILLLVNTFGILEILYIFLFSRIKMDEKSVKPKSTRKKK